MLQGTGIVFQQAEQVLHSEDGGHFARIWQILSSLSGTFCSWRAAVAAAKVDV
jgi:hypothetical protein